MRDRHERVSALACTSLGRHAEAMALVGEKRRDRRDTRVRKSRVAARIVPSARAAQDVEER
jgi:hypothetical protein